MRHANAFMYADDSSAASSSSTCDRLEFNLDFTFSFCKSTQMCTFCHNCVSIAEQSFVLFAPESAAAGTD